MFSTEPEVVTANLSGCFAPVVLGYSHEKIVLEIGDDGFGGTAAQQPFPGNITLTVGGVVSTKRYFGRTPKIEPSTVETLRSRLFDVQGGDFVRIELRFAGDNPLRDSYCYWWEPNDR